MQKIAHINKAGNIQTVDEHCKNVAEYAGKKAESCGLSRTAYTAGLLHDIGKNSNEFQRYIRSESAKRGSVVHSNAGGTLAVRNSTDQLTSELIACAILQHHGLMNCIDDGEDKIGERCSANELPSELPESIDETKIRQFITESSPEIRKYIKKIQKIASEMSNGSSLRENGAFLIGCLERLILSCLVDADWRDTNEFMSGEKEKSIDENERMAFWINGKHQADAYVSAFSKSGKVNELRSEMAEKCLSADVANHGIYRLSMPTGARQNAHWFQISVKARCKIPQKTYYLYFSLSVYS